MVFPTCVGMNRPSDPHNAGQKRVPHVCGDEPAAASISPSVITCSPRVWG